MVERETRAMQVRKVYYREPFDKQMRMDKVELDEVTLSEISRFHEGSNLTHGQIVHRLKAGETVYTHYAAWSLAATDG